MTVDLKWKDAMASDRGAFDAVERATGWPESMTPRQLASLQRPRVKGDLTTSRLSDALLYAIKHSCEAGELLHTTTSHVMQRQWSRGLRVPSDSMYWDREVGKIRTVRGVTDDEVKTHHIEAAPFAEWLRTQGEEPSQYIAHWFKVRGVAAPAVLQLTPPAPAVDAVVIPVTWAQLVAWPGRKEPGFVWTDNLRQIVASEKRRRSDLAHTGITAALGAELGCSARHINDLIGGIGKPGSRQQVLSHAVACLGNGTSGKDSR